MAGAAGARAPALGRHRGRRYNAAMTDQTPCRPRVVSAERLALAALVLGAVGIAFAPIFVRLSEIGPTATAFYRFALALPFLWAFRAGELSRGVRPAATRGGRSELGWFALAGLFFAADMGVWHWSITLTSVANATLLANTQPVFVVLIGWLIFGLRFRRLFLLGMALALAGMAVLMQTSVGLSPERLAGDLLGVVAAMFYAGYLTTVERLRARHSTAAILSISVPVSAALVGIAAWLAGESFAPEGLAGWAVLFGVAIVSQVLGQGLIAFALARLPVAFASVALLVQPLTAALLAWALFAEAIGPVQALGGLIVLAGIVIARLADAPKATA